MQKEIVKRIMTALEKSDVFLMNAPQSYYEHESRVIPQGLCFERCVVEHDLKTGCKTP